MKKMKRSFVAITLTAVMLISGCAKTATPTTPTTPTGLSNTVLVLDSLTATCEVASTLVSPMLTAWLSQCPVAVTAAANALSANSGLSATVAAIAGLQAIVSSAPAASTLSSNDAKYVNAILIVAKQVIAIYQQSKATTAMLRLNSAGSTVSIAKDPNPAKLKEIKSRAKKLLKDLNKRKRND